MNVQIAQKRNAKLSDNVKINEKKLTICFCKRIVKARKRERSQKELRERNK